ncbi:DUF3846 domain-containing protein [Streptosporangium oxazolinicum]|uniref:DUF3846 domain-containing protein n=1 Tax=Streptosporangium oxazolinicum TaxID=909287 RepID=A0ABP8BLC9_9ACTN
MGNALLIRENGQFETVAIADGAEVNLAVMYKEIGCRTVEVVALRDDLDMWLDGEGLDGKEVNPVATELARDCGFIWQNYHGAALLCGHDAEGNSIGLTSDQEAVLRLRLGMLRAPLSVN